MTTLKDEIKSANRNFTETFGRSDAKGMGKLYTHDGQLLPSNSDFITGTAGIQKFWQAVMDMGIKTAKLETVEVEGHGDMAFEVGRYTLGGDSCQVLDKGKYVVIWKQDGGQWKLHRDIWNTSMPVLE